MDFVRALLAGPNRSPKFAAVVILWTCCVAALPSPPMGQDDDASNNNLQHSLYPIHPQPSAPVGTQPISSLSSPGIEMSRLGAFGWRFVGEPRDEETIRITVGVKQKNLDRLHDEWIAIASPTSSRRGSYWTAEEVSALTAPDPEAVAAVVSWLQTVAPSPDAVRPTNDGAFVVAQLPAAAVATLLDVQLGLFEHEDFLETGKVVRTLDSVHSNVPLVLREHVETITPLGDFSLPLRHHRHRRGTRRASKPTPVRRRVDSEGEGADTTPRMGFINNGNHFVEIRFTPMCQAVSTYGNICNQSTFAAEVAEVDLKLSFKNASLDIVKTLKASQLSQACASGEEWIQDCSATISSVPNWELMHVSATTTFHDGTKSNEGFSPALVVCSPYALPSTIRKMYNVSSDDGDKRSGISTSGVILFEQQYYSPKDDMSFMALNNLDTTAPRIVAPEEPNQPDYPGDEAQADIELISANGVGGGNSTFWYSGDAQDGVLQWALQVSNTTDDVPMVFSLSWGIPETKFDQFVGKNVQSRLNVELAKIGLRGITVVVASGDAGVRDVGRSSFDCGTFEPAFPSSSPYVVSVSATMLSQSAGDGFGALSNPRSSTIVSSDAHRIGGGTHAAENEGEELPICGQHVSGGPAGNISCDEAGLETSVEVAVSCCNDGAVWTTGGGFSNNYSTAEWQRNAVDGYVSRASLPPRSFWNASGRAYPDVSAIGDKTLTFINGQLDNFGGTSASSPITAGLFSLLNSALTAAGKPVLGPAAPTLYYIAEVHPDAFRDITSGSNRCGELMCCDHGFESASGWDPVTGLGTINFGRLRDALLAL